MSLESIRSTLIRQEETIIFAIIERAQFLTNSKIYNPHTDLTNNDESFLFYLLKGTENLHASVRRYTSPEEHAFFPTTSLTTLPPLIYPELLSGVEEADNVNCNDILLREYIKRVVGGGITDQGDDEQYGSSVLADVAILQALSRRIHYGKFVAESKFRSDENTYRDLVSSNNADGVMELLTNTEVERKVLERAREKTKTYGREPGEIDDENRKIDPEIIVAIYRDLVIPLTKKVEVDYLFLRCGAKPPGELFE
ncbi:hypothetical protein ScalyP_jg3674 [Parmales sp. scaly parma]|nr:hypothetical protein ScalyP_jg3674 [Parmales sp. scaly parma]